MNFEQVLANLNLLSQREESIKRDPNLSDLGREAALKRVRDERASFRPQALGDLSREWRDFRASYAKLEEERKQAEYDESERWNYPKLEHERSTLRSKFDALTSLGEFEAMYNELESSGIPERRRALFELTPEYATKHKSGSLAKRAEQALAEISTTEEIRGIQERGSKLVDRSKALTLATQLISSYFPRGWMERDDFSALMDGVTLAEKYSGESGKFITELTVE